MRRSRPIRATPSTSRSRPAAKTAGDDNPAERAAGDDSTTASPDEAILRINRPGLAGGAATEIVRDALFVDGWAVARDGVTTVEIDLDGGYVAAAHLGVPRPDLVRGFPGHEGSDIRSFAVVVPAWALANGRRKVAVTLFTETGRRVASEFLVMVEHAAGEGGPGVLRRKLPLSEIQLAERIISGLGWRPIFALIIGIGEVDEEIASARRTLASLRAQVYGAWRVTVLRRGRIIPAGAADRLVEGLGDITNRIDIRLDAPPGALLADLAGASIPAGQPHLIGVLLAGDVLGCDALLEMAIASGLNSDAEFFYCDERRISPQSGKTEAFLKPQWSPDLLTATNYIGRFWCALPAVLRRSRVTMGDWFQFGDYELVLRCTEATQGISQVPKVLCERGRPLLDHPDQERAALLRAMRRRGIAGDIRDGALAGHYRLKRFVDGQPLVSIIIPTCAAAGRIKTCIESLRAVTAYRNFEVICVENIKPEMPDWKAWVREHADTVVPRDVSFNWSYFNNLGAQAAKGDYLLFLNDDTEIVEPTWLDALLEHAARPEVGVVGARLLYPDGTVQHGGIFWTPRGGRHAFRGTPGAELGYFGLALTERNVIAVTGACFMVRRSEYNALGGFDENHTIVNNDVDFCLRCWERGKSVVYAPHATLIHREGASRAGLDDLFDSAAFERRWGRKLGIGDPFHHPLLSRNRDDFAADPERLELVYSSRPLFARTRIQNILAVKLDHIGDFVTAVPALERLQSHFPHARFYLLAAPGVAELSDLVPGLAGTIEFEFFFAQSGLGRRELSADDFRTLQQRLEPYQFDLAVDFRKAPETRPVLQCSGARWLGGFDHNGQFPWLDIVVEWETDPAVTRKRSHVGDDLLRLADAVADAADPKVNFEPRLVTPRPDLLALADGRPPTGRKIVCVHPGVGSPIRQWPARHFATLIDLLTAMHDVEIALIGGENEADIAAEVIAKVQRCDLVRSLIGRLSLRELPQLLAGAALFVGNNSGPQHLAAKLGVPTVGIHSGTVDAREWGPLGSNAVALRRKMVCSPCYFSDARDCWRELACLTELQPADVYEICKRLLVVDHTA